MEQTYSLADKLDAFITARRKLGPFVRHEQSLRTNTLIEISHQSVRRPERKQHRFESAEWAPGLATEP